MYFTSYLAFLYCPVSCFLPSCSAVLPYVSVSESWDDDSDVIVFAIGVVVGYQITPFDIIKNNCVHRKWAVSCGTAHFCFLTRCKVNMFLSYKPKSGCQIHLFTTKSKKARQMYYKFFSEIVIM